MNCKHLSISRYLVVTVALLSMPVLEAATYHLNFFDGNHNVGIGKLVVAVGKTMCVETDFDGDCNDPNSVNVMTVKNPVISFSATVLGTKYSVYELSGPSWWGDANQGPGQQFVDRSFFDIVPYWFVGDAIFPDFLLIDPNGGNLGKTIEGGWQQVYLSHSGTWTGTLSTPIPSALWLFVSGLGILTSYKLKPNFFRSRRIIQLH